MTIKVFNYPFGGSCIERGSKKNAVTLIECVLLFIFVVFAIAPVTTLCICLLTLSFVASNLLLLLLFVVVALGEYQFVPLAVWVTCV